MGEQIERLEDHPHLGPELARFTLARATEWPCTGSRPPGWAPGGSRSGSAALAGARGAADDHHPAGATPGDVVQHVKRPEPLVAAWNSRRNRRRAGIGRPHAMTQHHVARFHGLAGGRAPRAPCGRRALNRSPSSWPRGCQAVAGLTTLPRNHFHQHHPSGHGRLDDLTGGVCVPRGCGGDSASPPPPRCGTARRRPSPARCRRPRPPRPPTTLRRSGETTDRGGAPGVTSIASSPMRTRYRPPPR